MHPTDAVLHWAKHRPRHLAVMLPYMAITYQALAEAIEAVSERIGRFGFDKGEPVAVAVDDPGKLLAVCLALLHKGILVRRLARARFPIFGPTTSTR